jgi:hypothetical protein
MQVEGVGHVPRETLVDEKEVDNVPKSDLMKVVAPTESCTPAHIYSKTQISSNFLVFLA